jgi:hypothetical protein
MHTIQHLLENIPIISPFSILYATGMSAIYLTLLYSKLSVSQFQNLDCRSSNLIISKSVTCDGIPFESLKVIVPSKSLNTTILVSLEINGIASLRNRTEE